ncbi:hypothetical protein SAMN05444161_9311 [Rhizobiales bacterium GAS191]|nr:hypothetical protein SAMN05519103_05963 [Rhizobiales bacterium GAS113]SEF15473.1 hypothetical protein SAMN05444161_9311 [Rhizobiales bacterium GAS191]
MSGADIMTGWEDALDAGELRFPRCQACGSWNWYPLPRCRACGSAAQTWTTIAPEGTLYSWTRVHHAFVRESVAELPYVTGIVDITGALGVRLVCLQRAGTAVPKVGLPVRLVLERTSRATRWLFEGARTA